MYHVLSIAFVESIIQRSSHSCQCDWFCRAAARDVENAFTGERIQSERKTFSQKQRKQRKNLLPSDVFMSTVQAKAHENKNRERNWSGREKARAIKLQGEIQMHRVAKRKGSHERISAKRGRVPPANLVCGDHPLRSLRQRTFFDSTNIIRKSG